MVSVLTAESEGGVYRFLTGTDMDPVTIRRTYPEARFIARARLGRKTPPSPEIWGILLHDMGSPVVAGAGDHLAQVMTDDGRVYDATVAGDSALPGEPARIVAAAKYWELPPAYVRSLPGEDASPEDVGRS